MKRRSKRGYGKNSYIKLWHFLDSGSGHHTTKKIAAFMGLDIREVSLIIHNLRAQGRRNVWTYKNAKGEWTYAVRNITPTIANFYTQRVAKQSIGVVRNSTGSLIESNKITHGAVKQIMHDTGVGISNALEYKPEEE